MIAVARTGALNEGDVLGFLPVGRPHQLAAGRTERVQHALELDAGDHIGVTIVAVGLDLVGIVRFPAGGPDHGTDLELDRRFLHAEIDGVVLARALGLLGVRRADDRGVDHVALRIGHGKRQIRRFHLVHAVVERIRDFRRYGLLAFAAGGAVFVHVTRRYFNAGGIVAGRAGDRAYLGQCQHTDALVRLETPEVDLQAAGGMAQLGEIFIELAHPAAEARAFFHQHYVLATLSGFEGRGHAADAPADHQYSLVRRDYIRHACSPTRFARSSCHKTIAPPRNCSENAYRRNYGTATIPRNRTGCHKPSGITGLKFRMRG